MLPVNDVYNHSEKSSIDSDLGSHRECAGSVRYGDKHKATICAQNYTLPMEESIMVPFEQLNQQNHEIAELSKVLSVLIEDREICDTEITCDLFMRYSSKVKNHLELEDKSLYGVLLSHPQRSMNTLGNRFVEGSREINRIFDSYVRRWCTKTVGSTTGTGLKIFNHDMFVNETKEMFQLIAERTLAEVEELYPAIRAIESEKVAASA